MLNKLIIVLIVITILALALGLGLGFGLKKDKFSGSITSSQSCVSAYSDEWNCGTEGSICMYKIPWMRTLSNILSFCDAIASCPYSDWCTDYSEDCFDYQEIGPLESYSPQGLSIDPDNWSWLWVAAERSTCCSDTDDSSLDAQACCSNYSEKQTVIFGFYIEDLADQPEGYVDKRPSFAFRLKDEDGNYYNPHGGAMFVYNDYLYIHSSSLMTDNGPNMRIYKIPGTIFWTAPLLPVSELELRAPNFNSTILPYMTWSFFDSKNLLVYSSVLTTTNNANLALGSCEDAGCLIYGFKVKESDGLLEGINADPVTIPVPLCEPGCDHQNRNQIQGFAVLSDGNFLLSQSYYNYNSLLQVIDNNGNVLHYVQGPAGFQAMTVSSVGGVNVVWNVSETGCIKIADEWICNNDNACSDDDIYPYIVAIKESTFLSPYA